MSKKEGYDYALEHGYIEEYTGDFYKLFKKIARLKGLGGNEKLILTIILSYTENKQEFHMSNNRLALETGLDDSTVSRLISTLKNKGWIKTYKIKDTMNNNIIGRTIEPQKTFINKELKKSLDKYIYEEY